MTVLSGEDIFDATLNAIILYDKVDFAAKANAMLEHTANRKGLRTHWTVTPWRVDVLEYPLAAEAALAEAAKSHLVVLAAPQVHSLLPRLMGWLERWAVCRQIQEAALAVWEGASAEIDSGQALPELSQFARRHGLSLIFNNGELANHKSSLAASDLHDHAVSLTPSLHHALEQPERGHHQHSGINE